MSAITEGASTPISANTPAFVALLHGTLADVRNPDPGQGARTSSASTTTRTRTRGSSCAASPATTTSLPTTTRHHHARRRAGDDTFQIGQIYGSPRISMPDATHAASVAAGDEFFTVATTAGFLSRGASFGITAYGGSGNDKFTVYSNKAELRLEGNDATTTSSSARLRW